MLGRLNAAAVVVVEQFMLISLRLVRCAASADRLNCGHRYREHVTAAAASAKTQTQLYAVRVRIAGGTR